MKAGELFAGYGGLALAINQVFEAKTAWVAEYDPAPSKILTHRFPGVPNLKDVTTVDWATVEPVDIIAGGSPCQDVSAAGARRGMVEGTRSNLWVAMREAIATIKPGLVVWENVKGAFSARADSNLEPCQGCMGGGAEQPVLRALGRVLGDLSTLGYDTQWETIRVSDIGGAHQRARIFVLAHRRDTYTLSHRRPEGSQLPHLRLHRAYDHTQRLGSRGSTPTQPSTATPETVVTLPTPNTMDHLDWREGKAREKALLHGDGKPRKRVGNLREEIHFDFGEYTTAIRRWETVTGQKAPAATESNSKGRPQLSPKFSEWLMGLPEGWVTDPAIGLTRAEQLKALGNGVVPQQAAHALAGMWVNLRKEN